MYLKPRKSTSKLISEADNLLEKNHKLMVSIVKTEQSKQKYRSFSEDFPNEILSPRANEKAIFEYQQELPGYRKNDFLKENEISEISNRKHEILNSLEEKINLLTPQEKQKLNQELIGKTPAEIHRYFNVAQNISYSSPLLDIENMDFSEFNNAYEAFTYKVPEKEIHNYVQEAIDFQPQTLTAVQSAGATAVETDIKETKQKRGFFKALDDIVDAGLNLARTKLPGGEYIPYSGEKYFGVRVPKPSEAATFLIPGLFLGGAYLSMTQDANASPEEINAAFDNEPTRSSEEIN